MGKECNSAAKDISDEQTTTLPGSNNNDVASEYSLPRFYGPLGKFWVVPRTAAVDWLW